MPQSRIEWLGVGIDASRAKAGAGQFTAATTTMSGAATKAEMRIAAFQARLHSMAATAVTTSKTLLTSFAGLGGLAAFVIGARNIAKYEYALAQVAGVTRATSDQLERLNDIARTMGATTRFSASQAAEGLLFLARAGLSADEAIEALPHTLKLATAGSIELGEAADIASNVMTQFGLKAEHLARVGDVLVYVANSANTDVLQLADAMKYAGSTAGALGLTVEETATAVGILGNAGIQSTQAGTNLRKIILSLTAPTTQAKEAILGLGLSLEAVDPSVVGLVASLQRLAKSNMDAAEANAIFGQRAIGGGLSLTKFVDALKQFDFAARKAKGTSEDMAAIMQDTLMGAWWNLKSALEAVTLAAGDHGFLKVMRDVLDLITAGIRVNLGMEDSLDKVTAGMRATAKVLKILGGFLTAIIALKIVVYFTNLGAAAVSLAADVVTMNTALGATLGLLLAIYTAILSYNFGTELYKNVKWVRTAADETVYYLNAAWEGWRTLWTRLWIYMKAPVIAFWNWFVDELNIALLALNPFLQKVRNLPGVVGTIASGAIMVTGNLGRIDFNKKAELFAEELRFGAAKTALEARRNLAKQQREADFAPGAAKKPTSDMVADALNATNAFFGELSQQIVSFTANFGTKTAGSVIGAVVPNEEEKERAKAFFAPVISAWKRMRSAQMGAVAAMMEWSDKRKMMTQAGAKMEHLHETTIQQLKEEAKWIGVSADEQERQMYIEKLKELGKQAGVDPSKMIEAYNKQFELNKQMEKMVQLGEDVGQSVADAFTSFVSGAQSAKDALKGLGQAIIQSLMQALAVEPIVNFFKSFMGNLASSFSKNGAKGLAWENGQLIPMAMGGIIRSPTIVPMRRGASALIGEAGPEVVMPIKRTRTGEIGVRAEGVSPNINVNMTVNAMDANSFGRSSRQMISKVQQAARMRR